MLELLKRADAKFLHTNYYVKLFADAETGNFSVYANNSNFNWGHTATFKTKEEAEKDFYHTIKMYDKYNWEVK